MPVAQIGADVFCDTRTIAAEIARLARRPALDLARCNAEVQAHVQQVDLEIFLACMACANTPAMGRRASPGGIGSARACAQSSLITVSSSR